MAPMAVPSNGIPLGVPMSNHEYDMTDADSFNKGPVRVGANPPPAWSQCKDKDSGHFDGEIIIKEYFQMLAQFTKLLHLWLLSL